MVVALEENLRFRLSRDLKEQWSESCEARKISQQDAITALLEFFVAQDEVIQATMLGQIPFREDLIDLALRAAAVAKKKKN